MRKEKCLLVDYIERGDCMELMKQIPDHSVDLVLCDLPYGTTWYSWDKALPMGDLWKEYHRVGKENAAFVLFGTQPFTCALGASNLKELKYAWAWRKSNISGFLNAKKQPMRCFEDILVFYRKQCKYNPQGIVSGKRIYRQDNRLIDKEDRWGPIKERKTGAAKWEPYAANCKTRPTGAYVQTVTNCPNNMLEFKNERGYHPTQKPVPLLEYLIKTYTDEGEVVLDNCMGSGSTIVAAVNTNRHYIGFELNPDHFRTAKLRLEEALENKGIGAAETEVGAAEAEAEAEAAEAEGRTDEDFYWHKMEVWDE